MRQDYADLMPTHRPPPTEEGLARGIGVSNYSLRQLDRLAEASGEVPVVNQIQWTPFGWSREMLDGCRERGIVLQAYSPLTRGVRLDNDRLVSVAERYDATPAQLLLRWSLQKGTVPLPKANRRDHMSENLGPFAFAVMERDMVQLDGMNEAYSALGSTLQYLER